ncbi:hypothetical protein Pmani_030068 [Petrolisthes manimaculis]|uniref:Uncharacterized protein n=1 Tax=Petrolisthes manimaculis TaxID=1843537 RepID=A0AAE1TU08_9EUCA|nr:hypothetical protein Pmani_030068 [Petrolisthes manimaculis]
MFWYVSGNTAHRGDSGEIHGKQRRYSTNKDKVWVACHLEVYTVPSINQIYKLCSEVVMKTHKYITLAPHH